MPAVLNPRIQATDLWLFNQPHNNVQQLHPSGSSLPSLSQLVIKLPFQWSNHSVPLSEVNTSPSAWRNSITKQMIHAVQLWALPTACNDFKSSQTNDSFLLRLIRRIFIPYTIPGLCYNTYFVAGSTTVERRDGVSQCLLTVRQYPPLVMYNNRLKEIATFIDSKYVLASHVPILARVESARTVSTTDIVQCRTSWMCIDHTRLRLATQEQSARCIFRRINATIIQSIAHQNSWFNVF